MPLTAFYNTYLFVISKAIRVIAICSMLLIPNSADAELSKLAKETLAPLEDVIYNKLPPEKANGWQIRIRNPMVNLEDKDVTIAINKLIIWILNSDDSPLKPALDEQVKLHSVNIAQLYKKRLSGNEPPKKDWMAAIHASAKAQREKENAAYTEAALSSAGESKNLAKLYVKRAEKKAMDVASIAGGGAILARSLNPASIGITASLIVQSAADAAANSNVALMMKNKESRINQLSFAISGNPESNSLRSALEKLMNEDVTSEINAAWDTGAHSAWVKIANQLIEEIENL